MYHDQENQPDPLDEFLAQLLKDFPDVLPDPTSVAPSSFDSLLLSPPSSPSSFSPLLSPPSPPSPPSPLSSSSSSPLSPPSSTSSLPSLWSYWSPPPTLPYPSARPRCRAPDAYPTCHWVSSPDSPLTCEARLSHDPKQVCNHFRDAHRVRGNEKVVVSCQWRDCRAAPMQRGSLIRHVLTVHLGLMQWRCGRCRKMFSRKGTVHLCVPDQ